MPIAFAGTTAVIAAHSVQSRRCPGATHPTVAARTGSTLMNSPEVAAGTRRRVKRSAGQGTADDSTPAATAHPAAVSVGGCRTATRTPTGRNSRADTAAAAADPCAPGSRRPTVRLSRMYEARQTAASRPRTLLVDRRTGNTTPQLWPEGDRPAVRETRDVDDWLTVIPAGRCVGMTAESTAHRYPRPGVVYRPVRDAEPIAVRLAWWRDDPHSAARAVGELLTWIGVAETRTYGCARP
ncbi:hypothetical protein QFZ32_001446 [Streptomyces canus]|uniref:LysR substrate-binding domain-containing protein n=1 Tax=Streptomyces canus TaxID=58343 RepID=A0AAW8F9T2_9ACTN|nr:hypothetical protein [Streptomyces canus]MDQ1066006.1 hypothetical protein [Streptomyces canus]